MSGEIPAMNGANTNHPLASDLSRAQVRRVAADGRQLAQDKGKEDRGWSKGHGPLGGEYKESGQKFPSDFKTRG